MRNSLAGCAGGAGVIACTSDGGRSWHIGYSGTAQITQLVLANDTLGWAVAPGLLLTTQDGGAGWHVLAQISGFQSIDFVDTQIGWAVTKSGISLTTDGGKSWHAQAAPQAITASVSQGASQFSSLPIDFINRQTGWAIGNGGQVYKTTNAGQSWQLTWTAPFGASWASGGRRISFTGPSIGWLLLTMGQGCASQMPYAVYQTIDGGQHWTLKLVGPGACGRAQEPNYPDRGPFGPGGYPVGFSTVGQTSAWLSILSPAAGSLVTESSHDSGASWNVGTVITNQAIGSCLTGWLGLATSAVGWQSVVCSPNTPLAIANSIWTTSDGGRTWKAMPVRIP